MSTKVLDENGVRQLASDIKTLADATYPAKSSVASDYDATSAYAVGDYCLYRGLLYKCNTAIAAGGEAWTVAHWTQVSVSSDLAFFQSAFKAFTATLISGSWSSEAQTISNANFVATGYAYLVYPQGSDIATYSENGVYADNVTTDGQMTFHCSTAPTSNLTVNIVRMYVS